MNLTVKGLVLFFLITAFSDGNNLQVSIQYVYI